MPNLSAVIIAFNEEEDLPRCLKSVCDLADEILVVDSGSTDKTVEIAKKFGAKVYVRKFDNYAGQKNFAASKAKGNWILSLDADEEISPELALEIQPILTSRQSANVAYSIPRKNIILGKLIRYTRWQPELDRHIWLWKRNKGKWEGDVHEEIIIEGNVGKLKYPKVHYQYKNVGEFLDMMNRYSELDAQKRVRSGNRLSLIRLFLDPFYNFSVRYFYRLGFLDGWRGFFLSYLMAIYHLELWIKIWERRRRLS